MAYVDYTYYTGTFLGTKITSAAVFTSFERKAELYLHKETFGNIISTTVISDAIKLCLCELTEMIQSADTEINNIGTSANISSESVGDYSISYATNLGSVTKESIELRRNKNITNLIRLYLNNPTDLILLYSGVK